MDISARPRYGVLEVVFAFYLVALKRRNFISHFNGVGLPVLVFSFVTSRGVILGVLDFYSSRYGVLAMAFLGVPFSHFTSP